MVLISTKMFIVAIHEYIKERQEISQLNVHFISSCHYKMTSLQLHSYQRAQHIFCLFLFQMTRLPHIFFLLLLYYYCATLSSSEPTQDVSPKLSSLRQSITQNASKRTKLERNMKKVIFNNIHDIFSKYLSYTPT